MIGKLKGRIDAVGEGEIVLDVGGVGYVVEVPERIIARLGGEGASATLVIETVVREDSIRLFGFERADEKAWFRLLQGVQGVGAKTASALIGALTVEELAAAIGAEDHAPLTRAPGIGAKLAKRIAAELKDKAPASAVIVHFKTAAASATTPKAAARADAISALVNLGYANTQASSAIDKTLAKLGESAKVEELIREGLKAVS